jgi:hypothetical protein
MLSSALCPYIATGYLNEADLRRVGEHDQHKGDAANKQKGARVERRANDVRGARATPKKLTLLTYSPQPILSSPAPLLASL